MKLDTSESAIGFFRTQVVARLLKNNLLIFHNKGVQMYNTLRIKYFERNIYIFNKILLSYNESEYKMQFLLIFVTSRYLRKRGGANQQTSCARQEIHLSKCLIHLGNLKDF